MGVAACGLLMTKTRGTGRKRSLFVPSPRPGLTQKAFSAKGLGGIVNVGDGKAEGRLPKNSSPTVKSH